MRTVLLLLALSACGAAKAPAIADTHFACGSSRCDAKSEYCEHDPAGADGPEKNACKPLPAPCQSNATCGCFPDDTPCAMFKMCEPRPAGDRSGLVLTCPNE